MLALLGPELVVGWAVRELIVANKIAKENKSGFITLLLDTYN